MSQTTKRYISAAVGLALLALVIFFIDTILMNVALAIIGILAVYEVIVSACGKARPLCIVICSIFVVLKIFISFEVDATVVLLVFLLFCVAMGSKGNLKYKEIAAILFLTLLVSYGFAYVIRLRDFSSVTADKRMLVLFGLGFGWLCDSMAYTFGKAFGKHKLCPNISPNKTVEGAVYGVIVTTILTVVIYYFYVSGCSEQSVFYAKDSLLQYLCIAAAGLIGSVIGILGDLSLSFVKRECHIKDFSNIMPGHGGALDRIDSVLFTATYAYIVFSFLL